MANPPKILHVLRSPRAEGTVRLALDLMQTSGAEHEVLVLEAEPGDLTGGLKQWARWIRIEPRLPRGPWKFPWIIHRVWRASRERKPDIVICWPNGFGAFVLLGAALAGVRGRITHAGNPPTPTFLGRAHTVMTTAVVWSLGGQMVCCSRYVAERFKATARPFSAVLRVVYNCAAVEPIRQDALAARASRQDQRPRLVMVATLEAHKDHATLLRAFPAVRAAVPATQLWLVGDGSLRQSLEQMRDELGLGGSVCFLGSRPDVAALLGQSDVFVFCTTTQEGLGTVLVEAMAAGLEVVATDVPACREVLADGRWGKLVPAGDTPALGAAIIESLRHTRSADSAERYNALQQYAPRRMMDGYLVALR
jgi:glycosyltransferase involved in cell wall biosynthesis